MNPRSCYRSKLFSVGAVVLLCILGARSRTVVAQGPTSPAPVLLSIAVTPTDPLVFPDQRQQFTAMGTYSDGHTHDVTRGVKWSSAVLDVATISWDGVARTVGDGQTTIQAALGAVDGSTTLTVSRFVWTGNMSLPQIHHSATLLYDGMVLIAGGSYNPNSAELYSPATGTFSDTGNPNGSVSHTATLLNNGMVLVAGGTLTSESGPPTTSAELYDPATGTFTPTGSMNTPRAGHTATLLNSGMVLIAGGAMGSTGDIYGSPLASAELYNPATGTFSYTGSLNGARLDHTATLLNNGKVLIAGGWEPSPYPPVIFGSAELYDPATGTFSYTTGTMNTPRYLQTATLLNNGKVLIAGGTIASPDGPSTANAELYDPAIGTFSYTGSMNTARIYHTATLLNNGMVLLAGGEDSYGNALSSAELYDPAAETFTYTSGMNIARFWDTGTLLNNGLVLIAGGFIATAELYNPATRPPAGLESIFITPERSTLSQGETERFVARGKFRDGTTQQLASAIWTTSNSRVAEVSNDASNHGVGLAIKPGTVLIMATAGHVKGWALLTVQRDRRE